MHRLAFALAACAACAPAEHPDPPRAANDPPAHTSTGDAMTQPSNPCDDAKRAIATRHFVGWRGLPAGCAPEAVVGVPFDDAWGLMKLGASFEPARSRLLDVKGYDRALAFARDGTLVAVDGMGPQLDGDWASLSKDLGAAEATRDWTFGNVPMPAGELIFAKRGVTIYLNPDNQLVLYVTLYAPTTVADYEARLAPPREKRMR